MRSKKLFRAIVGYGFALTTSVTSGVACSSPQRVIREGPTPHPCEQMTCTISGQVLDSDGTPLSGIQIHYDNQMASTDKSGHYSLDITGYGGGGGRITAISDDGREVYKLVDNDFGGEKIVDLQFETPATPAPETTEGSE